MIGCCYHSQPQMIHVASHLFVTADLWQELGTIVATALLTEEEILTHDAHVTKSYPTYRISAKAEIVLLFVLAISKSHHSIVSVGKWWQGISLYHLVAWAWHPMILQ